MSQSVITVKNAGKKFSRSLNRSMLYGAVDIMQSIGGGLPDSSKLRKDEFWAVEDVSFELGKGETLGIIGPNGSGKTTFLRMLNGIFMPDKGSIEINGRVGGLIQIGAGFHPMLSGRENIYVNGSILGMTRKEIDDNLESIIDFADIGNFLEAPVKHYSSGMFVRLGFAVAIHCRPDILLIDEILAVGDKNFQLKCYQKMNEIRKQGVTIILVSHNEYNIREQTQRCLYLNKGKTAALGSSEQVISLYLKDVYENKSLQMKAQSTSLPSTDKKAEILGLKFLNGEHKETTYIESGDELQIMVECLMKVELRYLIIGVSFYDDQGLIYSANNDYEDVHFGNITLGRHMIIIKIPQFHLPSKNYLCSVILADENTTNLIDWHDMAYKLVVGRADNARGLLKLPTNWKMEKCG